MIWPHFILHALMIMMTMTSIPGASKNGLTGLGTRSFSIHYGGLLSIRLTELGSLIGMRRAIRQIISVLSNTTFFEIAHSSKRACRGSGDSRKVCWPLFVRGRTCDSPFLASASEKEVRNDGARSTSFLHHHSLHRRCVSISSSLPSVAVMTTFLHV